MKHLRQGGKFRVAVEARFTSYELTGTKTSLTPDLKNWKNDVMNLYASWQGRKPQITLRNLVANSYPHAVYLTDIVRIETPPDRQDLRKIDQISQTTEHIFTFPTPLPSALARESVTWGEPEIKTSIMSA